MTAKKQKTEKAPLHKEVVFAETLRKALEMGTLDDLINEHYAEVEASRRIRGFVTGELIDRSMQLISFLNLVLTKGLGYVLTQNQRV